MPWYWRHCCAVQEKGVAQLQGLGFMSSVPGVPGVPSTHLPVTLSSTVPGMHGFFGKPGTGTHRSVVSSKRVRPGHASMAVEVVVTLDIGDSWVPIYSTL
jgi:hypothetical protein